MDDIKLTEIEKFQLLDIEKCVKADWNYKNEDEALTEKLISNMKRNGQIENILVRVLDTGFFEVVNGNHRLECMVRLGAKKVIAYNLGKISGEEARRIAIETNETKYQTDPIKLAQLIDELSKTYNLDDLVQSLPYSQQEIENFINMHNHSLDDILPKDEKPLDGNHEAGSPKRPENELFFKLNDDALELWRQWKEVMKEETGEDCSDYNSFVTALDQAVKYVQEEREFFNKSPGKEKA